MRQAAGWRGIRSSLLKHEAWMGRVADAAGGSYYVETITDFLAREGWKIMQGIEARGGYRKAQEDGAIAAALERSMAAREKAVASRRRVFVGTNQFANPAEQALSRCEAGRDVRRRSAERKLYEELRLRTERHAAAGGMRPRVLLAEFGDVKMRAARSNFAANFFACAGFETVTRRFRKATEIAAARRRPDRAVQRRRRSTRRLRGADAKAEGDWAVKRQ